MTKFLRTIDGNNYINVDYIEFAYVNDQKGIAYLHTTEHRRLDWKGIYEVPAEDWLAYYKAQK